MLLKCQGMCLEKMGWTEGVIPNSSQHRCGGRGEDKQRLQMLALSPRLFYRLSVCLLLLLHAEGSPGIYPVLPTFPLAIAT